MVLEVNGVPYQIVSQLGKGKGGYSYLATREGKEVVVKQIHHEPCSYYSFGNKIEAEKRDYYRLLAAGIRMPKMLDIDEGSERIVKEYIPGKTIFDLVKEGSDVTPYIRQVEEMAELAKKAGLNIDYFPTNFIPKDGLLYYVDYECNEYMEQWNFANWGIKYWANTPEFLAYIKTHQ